MKLLSSDFTHSYLCQFSLTFLKKGCKSYFSINQKSKNWKKSKILILLILWFIEMVYIYPPLTKVSVQLTNISESLSLSTPMVIVLFPVMAGLKDPKNVEKIQKIKTNQRVWFFWLFSRDMELLPCDLTQCHLCHFFRKWNCYHVT